LATGGVEHKSVSVSDFQDSVSQSLQTFRPVFIHLFPISPTAQPEVKAKPQAVASGSKILNFGAVRNPAVGRALAALAKTSGLACI
jgi:hypothetical protein